MKMGLTTKVNSLLVGTNLLLGALLGAYFIHQAVHALNYALDQRAGVLIDSLGIASEYPILVKDRESAQRLVQQVLRQEDVIHCQIENQRGEILAEAGALKGRSIREFHSSVITRRLSGRTSEDLLLDLPEHTSQEIGKVSVAISLEALHVQIRRVALGLSLIVFFVSLLTAWGTHSLLKVIFNRPMALLVEGTARLAKGNLNQKVLIQSEDEMGRLAASFNQMTEDLKKVTVSKTYMDNIVQSMTHMLVVVRSDLTIDTVNQALLDALHYSPEDLIGRPIEDLFSKDDLTHEFCENLKTGIRNVENTFRTREGGEVPILLSASVLNGSEGMLQAVICSAQDLTERKHLEKIAIRSEKMAAVGQLAAGVAHEINNPLGVILGFSDGLVRRMANDDALLMPIKAIHREATRCKNLVQDLLTFSRASKGDRGPQDINYAVTSALTLIQSKAKINGVEIHQELTSGLPSILANANQVQQVIINLATNALDAMPKGGTLTIKTDLLQEKPRAWVCLRILDTGTGIPPETLPRIFEPFFTTKPVGQGTGLGLSLVYEIMRKNSGMIDVNSRPGSTEFIAKFSVRAGAKVDEDVKSNGSTAETQEEGPTKKQP